MKIIKLSAENVMKLSAIEIVPKDNLILVTGENGAGKSSVLDSIVMALCGKTAIPSEPIKKGNSKGKIVVELEQYRIERSFTPGNSYLKIEGVDGATVKAPQKFLDELIGKISFDPLEFMNQKPEEQNETFLSLIGVDVKSLDNKRQAVYDQRTNLGRDLKKAELCIEGLRFYSEVLNMEEQSISALAEGITKAIQYNQDWDRQALENEDLKAQGAAHRIRIAGIIKEIEALQEEAADREASILTLKASYQSKREQLEANPKQDISQIQSQMANSEETNAKIRSNKEHIEITAEITELKESIGDLTKQISDIDAERKQLLNSAKMPVPGLSYEEGRITYNTIPLTQCSDGEKLMISLGISMALNPTLRVLRIKDGSLLDEKNRKIIYDRIKDQDFQLWMESVSSDKSVGIFIEDGSIVSIDGEAVTVPSPRKQRAIKAKFDDAPKDSPLADPSVAPETNAPATAPPPPEDW
jgi:DNA repair exonuclease SbcCD ATPase subunit